MDSTIAPASLAIITPAAILLRLRVLPRRKRDAEQGVLRPELEHDARAAVRDADILAAVLVGLRCGEGDGVDANLRVGESHV